jgi:3'-phosphoadenosine 5'-phosphosulfate sulfotransferase (PAPS reductase)/FAD synthetase
MSFFKKVGEALFGSPKTKKTSPKRTRALRIEELEPRELLSVNPLDDWNWDGWWDSFTEENVQIAPLPSGYNTDSCSEHFGQISIGGILSLLKVKVTQRI